MTSKRSNPNEKTLQSRCEQHLMGKLHLKNVLKMLEIAMIYKQARLEEKCLAIIILYVINHQFFNDYNFIN